MYQRAFWRGKILRHDKDDRIRANPEAPPMHEGPGEQDSDMPKGADEPDVGKSQPKAKAGKDELPLRHAHKKPHRRMHQVLMAHALRKHVGTGGTTMGEAVGGAAAGGGAG